MIQIDITSDMISRARERERDMPRLRNSITNNTATLHGFVGEEMVSTYFNAEIVVDYDYDIIKCGYRLEVKTKRTTVEPRMDYDASIAEFNTRQDCDYYVFTRVLNDLSTGWIMGMMHKTAYIRNARILKKGERDGSNGFIVKADCWNRRYDELMECDKSLFDLY